MWPIATGDLTSPREGRVNDSELVAGNNRREENRHRPAVLPHRWVDRDQRSPRNQLPELVKDEDIGSSLVPVAVA